MKHPGIEDAIRGFYPVLDTDRGAEAEAILEGGARVLQFRHKGFFSREAFEHAWAVAELCRQAGALFVMNDRADMAMLLGAALLRGDAGRLAGFGLALVGFGYSVYLTWLELFVIDAICQWCVASAVLMTVLFFQRRSSFPVLMTMYLAANVIVISTDYFLGRSIADDPASISARDMLRSIVAAAIWIPYLRMSSRSNETFVVRLEEPKSEEVLTHQE